MTHIPAGRISALLLLLGASAELAFAQDSRVSAPANNSPAAAISDKEIYQLKMKNQALLQLLIRQGLLDEATVRRLNLYAEQEAAKKYGEATDVVPDSQKDAPPQQQEGVVRVPYVSQHVSEQIREQVKKDLENQVVQAVMDKAAAEQWGVTNAWPAWLNRVSMAGDMRVYGEFIQFADENAAFQYLDFNEINRAGGTIPAGLNAFLNTTENQDRLRLSLRWGLNLDLENNWEVGFRIATGSSSNPVSNSVSMSNSQADFSLNLNRAFIHYGSKQHWLNAWFGRFENPWLVTDLVFDNDVSFQGVALGLNPMKNPADLQAHKGWDPFLTLGAFPLQELELNDQDKWLYAAQAGVNYFWQKLGSIKFAMALYGYDNVEGVFNDFGSELNDPSAPQFTQKGNTLYDIRNDNDTESQLAALASDYDLATATLEFDIAEFAPYHMIFTLEYVENIGFDADDRLLELEQRTALDFNAEQVQSHTAGHQIKLQVGHKKIEQRHQWNVSLAQKYLESDAVLDAFTDSDFHLGGTDGEGYVFAAQYGLSRNVWTRIRLFSSNEIHGAPLGVETYQWDIFARF